MSEHMTTEGFLLSHAYFINRENETTISTKFSRADAQATEAQPTESPQSRESDGHACRATRPLTVTIRRKSVHMAEPELLSPFTSDLVCPTRDVTFSCQIGERANAPVARLFYPKKRFFMRRFLAYCLLSLMLLVYYVHIVY